MIRKGSYSLLLAGSGLALGLIAPLAQAMDGLYQPAADEAVIYYKRADGEYNGWGLHLWDDDDRALPKGELDASMSVTWGEPLPHAGVHPKYGAYYVVKMNRDDWQNFQFIMHKGDTKDVGGTDQAFQRTDIGQSMFTFEGVGKLFAEPHEVPPIAIEGAKAHWIDSDSLVFDAGIVSSVRLYSSATADIKTDAVNKTVVGGSGSVALERAKITPEQAARFPHLAERQTWRLPQGLDLRQLLKQQLVVASYDHLGDLVEATILQLPGVIDALYADAAYNEQLGAFDVDGKTRFRVWAPTAQNVVLKLYDADKKLLASEPMLEESASGIWNFAAEQSLQGAFYRYDVTVYHPGTGQIEQYEVTDPYSLSLAVNSRYSQVMDLNAPQTQPEGWEKDVTDYRVEHPMDIVLYEGHVHDFSATDTKGTAALNGKYLAFTETERDSVQHLKKLQQAGLTHLHLLPTFDIATTNEDGEQVINLTDSFDRLCEMAPQMADKFQAYCGKDLTVSDVLAKLDPKSPDAQQLHEVIRPNDPFNWGYDPYHYTVPEGGYATDAEGETRIREFRQMVDSLHNMGLNVVIDVVYNHTNQSGVGDKSVLDRLVPGYYHRQDSISGAVENSTCCENTATEHRMMEKLMIDSLIVWARDYRIDAFRFDLMGHHMKVNMERALAAVHEVRPHVYFYGEGWEFGEVANNARGENAIQWSMAGTGIGTFSDRLRDAVRGGSPFEGGESLRTTQGFGNGLYWQPNELRPADESAKADLLHYGDQIRVGMAGNLRDFMVHDQLGWPRYGKDVDYRGAPTGYAHEPYEVINYVSKHDNQTLWDNNMYRMASEMSLDDRVRMHNLSLSIPMLSQSVPFFQMGSELLRSKSMERDSYDSGEWFNRVDFSYQSNNWNVGLPREDKDGGNWSVISPILEDKNAQAGEEQIRFASEVFQEFLQIRSSTPLLRLRSNEQIKQRVDFHNTGEEQIPGLIAMSIDNGVGLENLDPAYDAVMVVVNTTPETQRIKTDGARGFKLHPVQQRSVDSQVRKAKVSWGRFVVPPMTTAVFVKPQQGEQGEGLAVVAKDPAQVPPLGSEQLFLMSTATSLDSKQPEAAMDYIGNGQYQVELELDKRYHRFKLEGNQLSLGAIGMLSLDEVKSLKQGGAIMGFRVPEAGRYAFTIDASQGYQLRIERR